jgi:hypothetical protein
VPAEIPRNIHGHHNRDHCVITHLNTQTLNDYASGFYTIHRSDNPSPKTRASFAECRHPTHQHARPNAPKPIHPDKEQFCSSTTKLGANIRPFLVTDLCRNRNGDESKLEFPCK